MLNELFSLRYGIPKKDLDEQFCTPVIKQILSHCSVRKFESAEISDEVMEILVASAQSASTSSSLQAFNIIDITDKELRSKLARLSNQQQFINEASKFLVFVADFSHVKTIFEANANNPENLEYIDTLFVGLIDAALGAQNMLLAAESLNLGGVFVGALRNSAEKVSELLNLPKYVIPAFGLCLGKPVKEEGNFIKPRKPQDTFLHKNSYQRTAIEEFEQYDARVRKYFEAHGQNRDWLQAMQRRMKDPSVLHGRENLSSVVEQAGFFLK